jgi:hypothetical protein
MRAPAALVGTLLVLAAPLGAQSLFNASGLGLPIDGLDARARALGSVGIGLMGSAILPSDPAASAALQSASGVLSVQPSWVEFDRADGSESGSFRGQRFPMAGFAYPGPRQTVVTLSFASHLDQRYRAVRSVSLGLPTGSAEATDTLSQDGGVSVVSLGVARRLGATVSVGLSLGRYAGSVTRSLVRTVGNIGVVGDVGAYQAVGRWGYGGTQVAGGVSADLGSVARIAASAAWSSELSADASDGTTAPSKSFSLPLQLRVGASALLAPGLMLTGSVARSDWSDTSADLATGSTAAAGTSYGFGLELTRARVLGRQAPIRLGYRRAELPFDSGAGAPTESALTGGLGLALNAGEGIALGGVDVSLERGERRDSALTESFWRATVTLRVAGF